MNLLVMLALTIICCGAVAAVGYCAVWLVNKLIPEGATPLNLVIWVIVALLCLLIVIQVLTGLVGGHTGLPVH